MASGRERVSRREPAFHKSPPLHARREEAAASQRQHRTRTRGATRRRRSLAGRLLYWTLVAVLWLMISGIGAVAYVGAHLPPLQSLEIPKRPPSIEIVDVEGRLLARRGDLAGAPLTLKDLPPYVSQAFVAIEDRRFYQHYGVDPFGIVRALIANIIHRGLSQGGSTITQQLAKNLFLTQERTIERKIQEILLALWLEQKFSKAEILQLYLNRVYFGAGAYGIEQASQRYFGKSARSLTLAEAALLAGLVRSPSRLAPTRNFDGAERRAKLVLAAMVELNFISQASEHAALAHPPHVVAKAGTGSINYVADWVMDALNDVLGHVDQDIVVHTTIDADLQASAEQALGDELRTKGEKNKVSQGALVAMSPDGAVRALVGGRDYTESQFNRAVSARRQPGSAFKPFVYLTALERGLTPDTVRQDAPISVNGWRPENYEHHYYGPVTLAQALALSLNTVSVRLTLEVTPQSVVRTAHRLGIASPLEPNASIALGTSEVSVLELTGAYATFANGGFAVTPHVIARITDGRGTPLYVYRTPPLGRVVDTRHVGMMNAMMQETLTMGTARKASLPGWPAAGKTGTSQDFRDAWFVGFTAHLVTAIWMGNDDGAPTRHVTGGSLPVEVWSRFMRAAHQNVPVAPLPDTPADLLVSGVFTRRHSDGTLAPVDASAEPPRPPLPVGPIADRTMTHRGGLDGWLLDHLFGRR